MTEWTLWRQDDNGASAVIERFETREDAAEKLAALEARGHKQFYWIEGESGCADSIDMSYLTAGCYTAWGEKIAALTLADVDRIFQEWQRRIDGGDYWESETSFQYNPTGVFKVLTVARCLGDPARGYHVLNRSRESGQCGVIISPNTKGTVEVRDSTEARHLIKATYLVSPEIARQAARYFLESGKEDPMLNWGVYEEIDPQYLDEHE